MKMGIPKNLRAAQLLAVFLCAFLWVRPAYSAGEPQQEGSLGGTKWDVIVMLRPYGTPILKRATIDFYEEGVGEMAQRNPNWMLSEFNYEVTRSSDSLCVFNVYYPGSVLGTGVAKADSWIGGMWFSVWQGGVRLDYLVFGIPYAERRSLPRD